MLDKLCKDNVICCDDNCKRCANLIYNQYLKLKAENERLKSESQEDYQTMQKVLVGLDELKQDIAHDIKLAKAEAYKECIEKVKEEINNHSYGVLHKTVINYKLDNFLKELVGEDNVKL